jgi:hypothetical protein
MAILPPPAVVITSFVTPTSAQVGRLSFSATYVALSNADTVANADLLALCEQGPLRVFFAATYASKADVLAAWARGGGMLSVQSDASTAITAYFDLTASKVVLQLVGASAGDNVAVRAVLSYSASR